ncbi:MAG: hypothetical protein IIB05_07500 [Bacteroidetes bacterium]|nr:hypothetical protein [Bacteroidota bacterium]
MSDKIKKIISIILYVLMGISIILVAVFYFGKLVPGTEGTNMEEPVITGKFLLWAAILVIVTAGLAIIFPIINLISNPRSAKKGLFIILGVVILIFIAYSLASNEVLEIPGYTGKDNVPGTLKFAGTGLFTTYILGGLATLSILFSEVLKYFK